ncbi:hypothetical protein M440DRAFT_1036183 [Trichoderma longibrachiatum ATCC 18648]|uniref:Uncharacterized protein n=1 Tax=Trichoderma longibrachiatum ATCC 18648 TaxID=983965 RepID=A0A2T4BZX9_TRILO|nr:hypothetical protein M440DRAFT_1036183 [Trichoderma longibrachiatum ATCC 18648]
MEPPRGTLKLSPLNQSPAPPPPGGAAALGGTRPPHPPSRPGQARAVFGTIRGLLSPSTYMQLQLGSSPLHHNLIRPQTLAGSG